MRTDRVTCKLDAEYAARLRPMLEAPGDPWADWTTVKESRVRSIRRGTAAAEGQVPVDVHLKLFRPVRLSDRARDALSGARGVREFDQLAEARQRGIPCVRPLAAGRLADPDGSRSFLVTETIDAESLPRRAWDAATAEAAGALLRLAHDRGLHAPDLHPANVLRAPDGELTLCDLTSAVLANALEPEQRARALAFFCADLDGLVRDPCARPLLAAYGAAADLVDAAQRVGVRLRHRSLEAFGRRATRACRHTEVVSEGTTRWFLRRDAAPDLIATARQWAADPAGVSEGHGTRTETVKSGRRGAVHLVPGLAIKDRPIARATQLFRARFWLERAGVPAPAPVALRVDRRDGRGQVFSARIDGPDLEAEFPDLDATTRRAVAIELGHAVGRLHAFGLRHRDLKFENILREPARGPGAITLVDLDGVRRRRPLERRGQARDLGRLLAAYRARVASLGESPDPSLLRAFVRGYHSAFTCLQAERNPRLAKHIEERAGIWATTHPARGSDDPHTSD